MTLHFPGRTLIASFLHQSLVSSISTASMSSSLADQPPSERQLEKRLWYRSSLFNAFVIGAVGFLAPGMWNAMSSLGAGGAESPFLVNAANALVFCLSMFIIMFHLLYTVTGTFANESSFKWESSVYWVDRLQIVLG